MRKRLCDNCGNEYVFQRKDSQFCSQNCGAAYRWKQYPKDTDKPRACTVCGKHFLATKDANQKRVCSEQCRRARNSKKVREWHLRNPEREALYRQRTKAKQLPDSNLLRFRRNNPSAPTACEACGEDRVLDLAHKPKHERNGQWRSVRNSKWPEMVWVLCPTCHALLDRMRYPPEELGLK
jgi:predicted nucleic acid-binding Zn ribbon protein